MQPVLRGLKVVDLAEDHAGDMTAMYLADAGADVVKVERPGGDPTRAEPGGRVWNRGKRSVVLDVASAAGRDAVRRLAMQADVLVESGPPAAMATLGLDYPTLSAGNERLIHCSITGYGRRSALRDRPADDALVQARLGMNFEQPCYRRDPATGDFVDEPVFLYVPLASYGAAMLATTGIHAALHAREVTGEGQWVETSLAQGALLWTSQIRYQAQHEPPGFMTVPFHLRGFLFECADGLWVHVMIVRDSNDRLYTALDVTPEGRLSMGYWSTADDWAAWFRYVGDAFRRFNRADALAQLDAAEVPVVPVQRAADAYAVPQLQHNGMVAEIDDPELGRLQMIGVPYSLERNPHPPLRPQPVLGADTHVVLSEAGFSTDEIQLLEAGAGR
ncbi:MAG TPA: CoA transferase [Mycobacteriales bacterium]|jgi:crotonobetainyl-CoA:carnitine CoA-transferase CaiB-like acyl-CoA transferase|nr:CoA transferase [Mycobacteriales bacterium]